MLDIIIDKDINVPMVIASDKNNHDELISLIKQHHAEIIERLNEYGTILFRGFACQDAENFSQVIDLCGLGQRCGTEDYAIPRTLLPNNIYTSSDLPGHLSLPLHHEKPRSKNPPNHLYFCCITPAAQEGGTILANAANIWLDMPQNIQDKILEHGVVYKQFYHGKSLKYYVLKKILGENKVRSWHEQFQGKQNQHIEQQLIAEEVNWSWVNRGKDLIVLNKLPGVRKNPMTSQMCWFNSSGYLNYYANPIKPYQTLAHQYLVSQDKLPLTCHYGNEDPFSHQDILIINKLLQKHSIIIKWQKGDFMIVDNYTIMHGKQRHQGDRLLYSCMTQL